jgi:hypothetical protein
MYAPTTTEDDIPDTRKYGSEDEDTAKFTIIVPEHEAGKTTRAGRAPRQRSRRDGLRLDHRKAA